MISLGKLSFSLGKPLISLGKSIRWTPKLNISLRKPTAWSPKLNISLNNLINKQIKNIVFKFNNVDDLKRLKNLSTKDGETVVQILLNQSDKIHKFRLKDKRKINNQLLNTLNLSENVVID